MRTPVGLGATLGSALFGALMAHAALQTPAAPTIDGAVFREYAGVYQWGPNAFVYLQMWDEGKPGQLVAFDESGEVRTLYPKERDHFVAGPGFAVSTSIESRVEFQRARGSEITSLTWQREGSTPRLAKRVEIEKREDIHFSNGDVRLVGTLISPLGGGKRPAIILVHGSGAENRESILPFARFFIRRGIAVLGYDKRGVGGSTGDWTTASFDDLAGDAVAAFTYLKTRRDIDASQIGLLGISQAGWIMPLAAVRAKDMAFLISISGAGIPAAETTIDQARNEMTASGMPPEVVEQIVGLMKLQNQIARTGQGWEEYAAARATLVARAKAAGVRWPPPDLFPSTPDHPYWQFMRRLYFYDPAPTLRELQVPTLALFGELDNNIVAGKNKAAWETALKAGGNRDYALKILPKANHYQWEATIGSNAELASLKRFVPEYFTTIQDWLGKHVRGFRAPK
jgi:pimeloyl-ACP methyl ester carboxylesterase